MKTSIFHTKNNITPPTETVAEVLAIMTKVGRFSKRTPNFSVHPSNLKVSATLTTIFHSAHPAQQVIFQ